MCFSCVLLLTCAPLACSMEGGELFNRIQQRADRPFTERGALRCAALLSLAVLVLLHTSSFPMSSNQPYYSVPHSSAPRPHSSASRISELSTLFASCALQRRPRLCSRSPPPFDSCIKTSLHTAISSQRTSSIPNPDPTVRALITVHLHTSRESDAHVRH